jgi:hypothetical protein
MFSMGVIVGDALGINDSTGAVVADGVDVNDGKDITIGATTGTKIGQSTSKIALFGATPVVQPSAYTQTYSTTSRTVPNATASNPPAGGTGATAGAYNTAANRNLMITSLTNNIADVAELKKVVNSLIDDLQALGIIQ